MRRILLAYDRVVGGMYHREVKLFDLMQSHVRVGFVELCLVVCLLACLWWQSALAQSRIDRFKHQASSLKKQDFDTRATFSDSFRRLS